MEKIRMTHYEQTIEVEGGTPINVIVQIPDGEENPVQIILRAGNRILNFSLEEYNAIDEAVRSALLDGLDSERFKGKKKG